MGHLGHFIQGISAAKFGLAFLRVTCIHRISTEKSLFLQCKGGGYLYCLRHRRNDKVKRRVFGSYFEWVISWSSLSDFGAGVSLA